MNIQHTPPTLLDDYWTAGRFDVMKDGGAIASFPYHAIEMETVFKSCFPLSQQEAQEEAQDYVDRKTKRPAILLRQAA